MLKPYSFEKKLSDLNLVLAGLDKKSEMYRMITNLKTELVEQTKDTQTFSIITEFDLIKRKAPKCSKV